MFSKNKLKRAYLQESNSGGRLSNSDAVISYHPGISTEMSELLDTSGSKADEGPGRARKLFPVRQASHNPTPRRYRIIHNPNIGQIRFCHIRSGLNSWHILEWRNFRQDMLGKVSLGSPRRAAGIGNTLLVNHSWPSRGSFQKDQVMKFANDYHDILVQLRGYPHPIPEILVTCYKQT